MEIRFWRRGSAEQPVPVEKSAFDLSKKTVLVFPGFEGIDIERTTDPAKAEQAVRFINEWHDGRILDWSRLRAAALREAQHLLGHKRSIEPLLYAWTDPPTELKREAMPPILYNTNPSTYASDEAKQFVEKIFMPLLAPKGGKIPEANRDRVKKKLSNLTILSHSRGTVFIREIENALVARMSEIGYTADETNDLLREVCALGLGNTTRSDGGHHLFTSVMVQGINDQFAQNILGENPSDLAEGALEMTALAGNSALIRAHMPTERLIDVIPPKKVSDPARRHSLRLTTQHDVEMGGDGIFSTPLSSTQLLPRAVSMIFNRMVSRETKLDMSDVIQTALPTYRAQHPMLRTASR